VLIAQTVIHITFLLSGDRGGGGRSNPAATGPKVAGEQGAH
jgi:hypothetical protein